MIRNWKALVLLGIGCFLWLMPIATAQESPYAGLDILFLVDQSGSMGGSDDHPIPNDPNELRFYAPIHAMRWLGSDRLQVHTTSTYRMAVLQFGDRVQVGLDWQTIAPESTTAWDAQKADLEQELAFEELRTRHLGGTNFLQALEQAKRKFTQLPDDPAGLHRQALIILTDGEPALPNQTPDEHMQQVRQYVEDNFSSEQFTLCVIAMNDASSDYWTDMKPHWEQITEGCAVKVVSNEKDVGAAFRVILRNLTSDLERPYSTQTEDISLEIPATLAVPPYLQSIAFTLDKADPEQDKVFIEVLEGESIGFGTSQVQIEGEDEPIETITIYDPPPGRWQILGGEGTTLDKVDMRQIRANGVLLAPLGVLPLNSPTQVLYQVQTSQGKPLPTYSDPRYALQVQAEVTNGDRVWPLQMAYDAGQNVYAAEWTPTEPGRHTVRLSATSHDIEGREITVFPLSDVGSFDVGEVMLNSQSPGPETQPLFQPRTLAYTLSLAGQPLAAETPLSAEASFSADSQTWRIPLTTDDTGALKGEFIPVAAGPHQGTLAIYAVGKDGQRVQLVQESLSPFTVASPTMTIEPAQFTQYCAGEVVVQVDNGMGQSLVLPSGYSMSAEAILEDGNRSTLTTSDGRSFRGSITPSDAGSQALSVQLDTRDPAGQEWLTIQEAAGTVDVARSIGLTLEIVSPAKEANLPARSLQMQSIPLTVTLALKDEAGNGVDPSAAMEGQPFQITFLDKEGEPQPVDVSLAPSGTGRFQGTVEGLGTGRYTVVAQIAGQPVCGYHILDPGKVTREVQRVESPTMIGLLAGGPVLLLALIVAAVVLARRSRRKKAHPCKGRVLILDDDTGQYVFNTTFPTGRHQSNHHVYKGKKLGQVARSHFSQIEFTCTSEDESKRGIVRARIWDLEGEEVFDGELRPPRGTRSPRRKVRKKRFYVYKDPIEF